VFDIWGNWNPTFVKDSALTLGFNVDFGYDGASGVPATAVTAGAPDSNTWWGAALYASYKFNKVFTLSGRAEYLHEDEATFPKFGTDAAGTPIPLGAQLGEDDYSYTITAAFSIWDNLLTRAEYRIDDLGAGATGTGDSKIQNEISLEAVYSF